MTTLHPLDAALFTTWAVIAFYPLLGLTPEAGAIASAFLAFAPESHAIHHGRGIHRWSYCDLPLWDMVFGTFRNPKEAAPREAGFYGGASAKLGPMLAFREVA